MQKSLFFQPLLAVLFAVTAAHSYLRVNELQHRYPPAARDEARYFPNGKALGLISFGYSAALGHALWFSTINYFGKHFRSDRDYQWLSHMCTLVVRANPNLPHAYEFCGLMLAWEASRPQEAMALLGSGIHAYPRSWKLYYLRGMTSLLFLKDEEAARRDFVAASTLPGVHYSIVNLAAKKLSMLENPETAVEFLAERIQNADSDFERKVMGARLKELMLKRDIALLEHAVAIFADQNGRVPTDLEELLSSGIVTSLPKDPYDGTYFIDPSSGRVHSSSQEASSKEHAHE